MPVHFPDSYWTSRWASDGSVRGAILGAGLGRRLEPLTAHHLPKPVFPLGGKVAIAELWVRRMIDAGIRDVCMNTCHLEAAIEEHFAGGRLGVPVRLVHEDVPTGTLGGVCKQALGRDAKLVVPGEPAPNIEPFAGTTVLAPSGDIVTNFSAELLGEMYATHKRVGAAMTIVLTPIPPERRGDFGTVVLDAPEALDGPISASGRVVGFVEKDPNSASCLNNASVYMIEMDLLRELDALRTPAGVDVPEPFYDFGKHVFPALLGRLPYVSLSREYTTWGLQYDGGWFDVGNKRDYLEVNRFVLDGAVDVPPTFESVPWGAIGADVHIDLSAVDIHPPVVLGDGCVVEPGASLGPHAVVGAGWRIGAGATVRDSVLWERSAFTSGGERTPARARAAADPHIVRPRVTVDRCIVASGDIDRDVVDSTVHADVDGALRILPLDYVPSGPRA